MENEDKLEEQLKNVTLNEPKIQEDVNESSSSRTDIGTEAFTVLENVEDSIEDSKDHFPIRTIPFLGTQKRIIMQTANGPCPLIAIVNTLVLKGKVTLPVMRKDSGTIKEYISLEKLTELVGGNIVDISGSISKVASELEENCEVILNDVLNILPNLSEGLEVNVRFSSIKDFEYTSAISLFDLLGIPLYHTWVVEQGSEFEEAVKTKSYNEVTTLAFDNDVFADFLDATQSQMTYTGLLNLLETMRDNELAVLFRNNHFHTLFKTKNAIHVLCTDVGFLHQTNMVWEVLESIEGDTTFVNGMFTVGSNDQPPQPAPSSVLSDYELAKSLSAQYNPEQSSPHHSEIDLPPETLPEEARMPPYRRSGRTTPKQKCTIS